MVQLLIGRGANIGATGYGNSAALHHKGHRGVVQLLLGGGASFEAIGHDNSTALHCAASRGHRGVVQLLLEMGVSIEATGHGNSTAPTTPLPRVIGKLFICFSRVVQALKL